MKKFLIILAFALVSCSKTKEPTTILPFGNMNNIVEQDEQKPNTKKDDVAPTFRPDYDNSMRSPFVKDFQVSPVSADKIKPSSYFAKNDLNLAYTNPQALEYLTSSIESISFINSHEGFISFSHPPTPEVAKQFNMPLNGLVGGTDLFKFELMPTGGFKFKALEGLEVLNSIYWDSHPYAADTIINGKKVLVVLWASDRNSPYSEKVSLDGKRESLGNTDIYYSFMIDNNWSEPKALSNGVNSKSNELSPFLYCFCFNPVILFSSNRDNKLTSDYDLYYAELTIDFENQIIDVISDAKRFTKTSESEKIVTKDNNYFIESKINSFSDDRFPYITQPVNTPESDYLYFSSNRHDKPIAINKDTIINSVGGFDIYRFPLNGQFRCIPPPPPSLYISVLVNETKIGANQDTLEITKGLSGVELQMNGSFILSGDTYKVDLNKLYEITRNFNTEGCEYGVAYPIEITTPRAILKDDTLRLTLETVTYKKPERRVKFSDKQGIAVFTTGYWWPLTTNNLSSLKSKISNNSLNQSQFIDLGDYDYYNEVAKRNDDWFNEFYDKINKQLQELDKCYDNQKVVITVHGFTDPCRLRQTKDDEFTKYTGDGDFVFNDIVVSEGLNMKKPDLKTTSGASYSIPGGNQDGNAMLAMLRAYFTKKTIEDGFESKYADYSQIKSSFRENVKFNLDFFGIYNEKDSEGNYKRGRCPEIDKNILTYDLPNKPSSPEDCNLPHSRRVMIYIDVVSNKDIEKGFRRNECGQIETPLEKVKPVQMPIIVSQPEPTKFDLSEADLNSKTTKDLIGAGCAGICYWIEYGVAKSNEEYEFLLNLFNNFEIDDVGIDPRYSDKIVMISSRTDDLEFVTKKLDNLKSIFSNKFSSIASDFNFKAKIKSTND